MGITGLETAFPVLYTSLVKTGLVPLGRILDALTDTPRRIFGLEGGLRPGCRADITLLDLDGEFTIDSSSFLSKGRSTPFDGMRASGRAVKTFKDGRPVWEDTNS